jgi:hypothetical protein
MKVSRFGLQIIIPSRDRQGAPHSRVDKESYGYGRYHPIGERMNYEAEHPSPKAAQKATDQAPHRIRQKQAEDPKIVF